MRTWLCGGVWAAGCLGSTGHAMDGLTPAPGALLREPAWVMAPGPVGPGAGAVAEGPAPRADRWVLGATVASAPAYAGGGARRLGLRPVLAGRVGRWMLSTSSARALAGMDLAGGISTTVATGGRWQLGVGVRLTPGRANGDDPLLAGLPDVSRSVGVRLALGQDLAPGWRATASLQQDLLHRQGLRLGLGVGWSHPLGQGWALNAGASVGWADARALRTFYGVAPGDARAGRPAWLPGAGAESWGASWGVSKVLGPHARLAASVGRHTLLGQAARSPLVTQPSATLAQVTWAYVGW